MILSTAACTADREVTILPSEVSTVPTQHELAFPQASILVQSIDLASAITFFCFCWILVELQNAVADGSDNSEPRSREMHIPGAELDNMGNWSPAEIRISDYFPLWNMLTKGRIKLSQILLPFVPFLLGA
jgi:hypothetical protein